MLTSVVGGAKNAVSMSSTLSLDDPVPDLCVTDVRAGIGLLVSSMIGSNGASKDLVAVDLVL